MFKRFRAEVEGEEEGGGAVSGGGIYYVKHTAPRPMDRFLLRAGENLGDRGVERKTTAKQSTLRGGNGGTLESFFTPFSREERGEGEGDGDVIVVD